MDCLFCKIINNEIPSYTIYEDDLIKVFLDINPNTLGDSLIVPKKHLKDFQDLDNELLLHIEKIKKELYKLYQEKLHCEGLTCFTNTDYGQDIKHFHVHFTPRYKNDELKILSNKEKINIFEDIKKMLNN